ncbi:hypothetical protein [Zavarzinia sp.]|uniref:hypothetical protein n=1 Tax=Zavarzinia sp. TaxID=2027920 RepID=UPI003BB733E3
MNAISSKKAVLFATSALAVLAAAGFGAAQDAIPVSEDQFGYGSRAVAETSFNVDLFGGGDENGGTYGGAPTITIPLGDKMGLQVDGIAGATADESFFAGGAAQLFYRDPQQFLVGVAGGGYFVDSVKQYAVAGIAEYYLDNVTLEGLVGYQTGDVTDGAYGRVGLSVYANPNLRIGGGVSYSEEAKLGGDVQVEALLTDVPGLALFATGVFDERGSMGFGGVRFYLNSGTSLLGTDRTKQSAGPTLIGMHRNLGRPNFFLNGGAGFGLRQISLVGGALNGGDPFGDVHDPDTPVTPVATCGDGVICSVEDVLGNLTDNTALEPLTDLIDALLNPNDGALSALTGALDDLTSSASGPLGAVTDLVNGLVGTQNQALEPLIASLNDVLSGLTGGLTNSDIASGLLGGLGGTSAGATSGGLIDVVQGTVGNLLDGTPLQGVADLVDTLVDPQTGALSPLTGQLNDLTSTDGGALAPVTQLVDGLAGAQNGALDPVLDTVNGVLSGDLSGASAGTDALADIPVVGDLLGGLLGGLDSVGGATSTSGGATGGLIDVVQGTVGNLLDGTPLQAVADLVDTLVDPQTGALSPLTGQLNDLTSTDGGALAPVTQLVDGLAGAQNGALDPVLDTVNDLLSGGLSAGGGTAALTDIPVLGGLLSGLLGGLGA